MIRSIQKGEGLRVKGRIATSGLHPTPYTLHPTIDPKEDA